MSRPIGIDPASDTGSLRSISIDGSEIQRLAARYREQDQISEEEWDDVIATAARALSQCPDPAGQPRRGTGLALGKVQSGKTLSYTALIALAADNGYRITVVLAGTKNPLLEQTYTRLSYDLDARRRTVVVFKNPLPQDADVVLSVLHGGGHALVVALKHRKRIDDVRRLLAAPELKVFPTLVIDDEGDEASLNTQFRSGRLSATYRSILSLRDALPLHAYMAYTATPQANLLIDGIDALSPDFAVLVEPGSGYCGGSVFFGEHSNSCVRQIPAGDGDPESAAKVTGGLRQAIATFLVGAAIRFTRGDHSGHSMLVHTSHLRADHESLQRAVRNLILKWRETVKLRDDDPEVGGLLTLARGAYDDLCTTVESPPPWSDVRAQLRDEVWLTEVWMVNSLPLGRDPIETPFRLRNNILIGGNMLGRGVTIPQLAVTYITREAQQDTNADTLEQRARWFGYKQAYCDLCRIFLTSHLRDRYTELLRHEDDFWEALRRNERQRLLVRDWPRMFRLDMRGWQLRPTRPSVANYRQFRGGGWDIQNRLVEDLEGASCNVRVVTDFFRQHTTEVRRYGNVEHLVIPACQTDAVISELLAQLETQGTDWESTYTIEYLTRLLLGGRLPAIEVLRMTEGQPGDLRPRVRTKRDGRVNPMQGRSPEREPTDPMFYPGDENIHSNQPQLQVHLIRAQGDEIPQPVDTTALALYIPKDDPLYDLRAVVRGEERP
ncbi:MAG: hypothetical protein HYU86_06945 [Chloroflexi bacterium]|nr:hypothetical protein [Chloroflexota bacterium]